MLYPRKEHLTLARKLFRREPAITEFDKLFTPYHKSSQGVVQPTGSGLPQPFGCVHPAHGKLISIRVVCIPYNCPIQTRFPYAFGGLPLRRRACIHSQAHSSIGTPSRNKSASTHCKRHGFSSISPSSRSAFHLSLTVLVHYRSKRVFSLTG